MLAAVAHRFGDPETLILEARPDPQPRSGEVVIEVHAAGINPADAYQVRGQFQLPPADFPFTPGFEVAGRIAELGDAVEGWSVGDRVLATCVYGAYAERLAVTAEALVRLPEAMPFATAAAIPVAYGTAAIALDLRAQVQAEDIVVVLGASGAVGAAAIELARARGCRVLGSASDPSVLRVVPDAVFPHRAGDVAERIHALTDGRGADVVLDMVGGHAGAQAIRALAWGGRSVVVGAASGELHPIEPFELLTGNKGVLGVDFSTYIARAPARTAAILSAVLADTAAGRLSPPAPGEARIEEAGGALAEVARFARGKTVLLTSMYRHEALIDPMLLVPPTNRLLRWL